MKAIVVEHAGGPEVLQERDWPRPQARLGWVLIQVKAFGLNRSELYTRLGQSPSVSFPRVLGIECVGTVVEAPGTPLQPGQTVAAVMGGMGREFDGSYAHYTLVPAEHVLPFTTSLPWEIVGAIPETFLTAAGSLDTLQIQRGQTLLVRGGTSSVGLAAIVLAKQQGLTVLATTRNQHKVAQLRERGVDQVLIDTGHIANDVRSLLPGGVNVVLELVGIATLFDSLQATTAKGIVCLAGGLGNVWEAQHFSPMGMIPLAVRLTVSYGSGMIVGQERRALLQKIVDDIEAGSYQANVDRVFPFVEIAEAHRYMENDRACGKIVVRIDES